MATAPIIIPGAVVQLATGVVLDATLTTAQTILTVPIGMRAVFTDIVFRDASAAVNAATTFSVGVNGTANNLLSANTSVESMPSGNAVIKVPLSEVTGASAVPYGTATSNMTLTFAGTLTSNGKVKVDVIGYLEAL